MKGNLNGASFVSTKAGDEYCGYCLADGVPVLSCRCEGGEEVALRCEGLVLETGRDYLIEFDYLKSMDVTAKNWSVLTLAGTDCPEGGDFSILQGDYSVRGALAVLCQGEHHVISNLFLPDERYVHFSLLVGADGGYTLFIGGRFVGGFRPKIPAGKNPKSIVLGAGEDTGEVSGWAFWKNFSLRDATGDGVRIGVRESYRQGGASLLEIRAPQSDLVFNARALRGANLYTQGDWVYPGFTRESSLFGRTFADADQLGTFALRWVGNCYKNPDSGRIELQCHTDYGLEVNRVSGRSGAFTTYTRADFCPIAGAASYYFFEELPGVYYVDLALRRVNPRKASSYSLAFMMFTEGPGSRQTDCPEKYNGFRIWHESRHTDYFYGADYHLESDCPAPKKGEGVFLRWESDKDGGYFGAWYHPRNMKFTRGAVVCQKDGQNDWAENPPAGMILRTEDLHACWVCNREEYMSIVPNLRLAPMYEVGDKAKTRLICFCAHPDGPLDSDEAIENLDFAFNHPLRALSPVLRPGEEVRVCVREEDGVARRWQFVQLDPAFGALRTVLPVCRGGESLGEKPLDTLLLLRDVQPGEQRELGILPLSLRKGEGQLFEVVNETGGLLRGVTVELPCERRVAAVKHELHRMTPFVQEGGLLTFTVDIQSGVTQIDLDYQDD